MKRILCLLITLTLVFSLPGCSGKGYDKTSADGNSTVVLPDEQTAETVNGYKPVSSETHSSESSSSADVSSWSQPSSEVSFTANTSVILSSSQTDESSATVIGNKNSKKYHLPDCRYVKQMSEKNVVRFSSLNEAESAGYTPCSTCTK